MPFLIGFLIAYILNFPYKFFYSKVFGKVGTKRKYLLKIKKPLSVVCTYALVLAILVFLVAILVPQITENISSLVKSMPGYFETLMNNVDGFIDWVNLKFNLGLDKNNSLDELLSNMSSYFSVENLTNLFGNASSAISSIMDIVSNAYSGVYNFIMGVIISIYFLAAKDTLCRLVKRLAVAFIPIRYLPKIYEVVDITDTKCGRFLVGDIIDSALVGVMTFVIMSIFQLPYAALISVLIGITNIIPFFGPFIGAIPSAFILLLIDPWYMVLFIIIVVVIQQLDGNLFKPKIIGSQVGLSSFWVLFSVVVGGALFGLPGFILSTPIFAVIYSLVGKSVRNRINDKGKLAQEALDFEVLNYTKIAEEQKKLREQKDNQQFDKLKKMMGFDKNAGDDAGTSDNSSGGKSEKTDDAGKNQDK